MEYPYEPIRFDVVRDHLDSYLSLSRTGEDLTPQLTTWQGHSAWMLETGIYFDPPMNVKIKLAAALIHREYTDADSGQPLGSETILINPNREEVLEQRYYYTIYQTVDTPPQNAHGAAIPADRHLPARPALRGTRTN